VRWFSNRFDFSTTDVANTLKITAATVRLVLERMERAGKVARMVEVSGTRTGGRPAPRWTSNADNMSTQLRLGVLARRISDDDDDDNC
jgi:predicted ArsR family transcriptional regulator